ncbi:hypothetical protein V1515DRAFT_622938 [Lipomyces mesembrius]
MNSIKSSSSILSSTFSSGVSIPIYNNKNFIIWESRIKAYLRAVKAIKAIEEDVPIDGMTSEDIEADDIAKGPYDMFDSIRQRHRASAKQREAYLVDELYLKKMSDDEAYTVSVAEWDWLRQVHAVLSKFNELALIVSEKQPQISNAVSMYYDLQDILEHASEQGEELSDIDPRIARAVTEGMKKFQKYYTFMDVSDTYYTALILDPKIDHKRRDRAE